MTPRVISVKYLPETEVKMELLKRVALRLHKSREATAAVLKTPSNEIRAWLRERSANERGRYWLDGMATARAAQMVLQCSVRWLQRLDDCQLMKKNSELSHHIKMLL